MNTPKTQTYKVHLTGHTSVTITVYAEDPDDAIDKALDAGVPGICSQCSGWGQRRWWRDEGDEWTPESVTNDADEEVWTAPSAAPTGDGAA